MKARVCLRMCRSLKMVFCMTGVLDSTCKEHGPKYALNMAEDYSNLCLKAQELGFLWDFWLKEGGDCLSLTKEPKAGIGKRIDVVLKARGIMIGDLVFSNIGVSLHPLGKFEGVYNDFILGFICGL